jgi:ribosomal protein S18 acetylase RimI-like enzyme
MPSSLDILRPSSSPAPDLSPTPIMGKVNDDMKNDMQTEWFNPEKPMLKELSTILVEQEQIIGFLILQSDRNGLQIKSIGLLPAYRNKGLGKKLLRYSLKKAKEKDYSSVELVVALENVPAYNLFSKIGFKPKTTIETYRGGFYESLTWSLFLTRNKF